MNIVPSDKKNENKKTISYKITEELIKQHKKPGVKVSKKRVKK